MVKDIVFDVELLVTAQHYFSYISNSEPCRGGLGGMCPGRMV